MSVQVVRSSVLLTMTTKQNTPLIACVMLILFAKIKSGLLFFFRSRPLLPHLVFHNRDGLCGYSRCSGSMYLLLPTVFIPQRPTQISVINWLITTYLPPDFQHNCRLAKVLKQNRVSFQIVIDLAVFPSPSRFHEPGFLRNGTYFCEEDIWCLYLVCQHLPALLSLYRCDDRWISCYIKNPTF